MDAVLVPVMIGQTISHYRITAKLGAGGMGEVYLATDTKLDRQVALKFLPESLQQDPESRQRLLREAKAASKLNHPNILTVYAVEEAEGRDFIAMEYVEGRSLKDLITSGDLDMCGIVETAIQIGEGLAEAHAGGVVHRDIKSDNVIISAKDKAKVMDFGLATWGGAAQLTKEGSTVGTIAYMSPEQAQGQPVDQRTDLWSLGVVLYEMVTRHLPFEGDHDAAITYSIVNETPHPLARYSSAVPEELQRVVSKCLNKDREQRYQSAADLVADLRALRRFTTAGDVPIARPSRKRSRLIATLVVFGVAVIAIGAALITDVFRFSEETVVPRRKMLAVLPFQNLGDPDDEYFADGITEEITARLAKVAELGVIARTSIIQYKNTKKTVAEIGEELGVDYILEGTIRWQKLANTVDRVRVTPQLINVGDATHKWADIYDEALTEVFQVQADIAEKVVAALNITLFEPERHSLESKSTDNLEAYDYYLRGNDVFDPIAIEDDKALLLASRYYQKAVAADSNFAEAYAKLARALIELYWHHGRRPGLQEQARLALDRALALNPDIAIVHISLGSYYYHREEHDRALEEFARAERTEPNNAQLQLEIGYTRWRKGEFDQALIAFQRAAKLDPQAGQPLFEIAYTNHMLRRFDTAAAYYDRAIAIAPDYGSLYCSKAWLHIMRNGDTAAACRILDRASEFVHWSGAYSYFRGMIHVCSRDYGRALQDFSLEDHFHSGPHIDKATVYEILGDSANARLYYDSARVVLEQRLTSEQDDPQNHSCLGVAYAGLGRREDAIREGELATRQASISHNAIWSVWHLIRLARIYVMTGETEKALDQLEFLLSIPSFVSTASIRINPIWAPLRDHPGFAELMEKYS